MGKKSKGMPVRGKPSPGVVRQVGGMGCGVACVAAILGRSYAAALTLFEGPGDDQGKGFPRHEMIAALEKGGKRYKLGLFGPLAQEDRAERAKRLPVGAIVWLFGGECPWGHYLVHRQNGRWMDPQRNAPRQKLPSAPLVSFIVPA